MKTSLFKNNLDRRALLRRTLWTTVGGAVAFNELGLGPTVESLFQRLMLATAGRSLDSRVLLAEALGGGPSLFRWSAASALAQATSEQPLSVVHIKVMNHVATPLVFRLGAPRENGRETSLSYPVPFAPVPGERLPSPLPPPTWVDDASPETEPIILRKILSPGAKTHLDGLRRLSQIGLYPPESGSGETYGSKFHMNEWFAAWLHNPQVADDQALGGRYRSAGLVNQDLNAAFDHSRVGLQCALGLDQTRGGNHSLKNLKLRSNMPDLGSYIQHKGILRSPLGVSVFMMGGRYDSAEGQTDRNVLLGNFDDESEVAEVRGDSVREHALSIQQAIDSEGKGYADDDLIRTFDELVSSDISLRVAMQDSRQRFRTEVLNLVGSAGLETVSAFASVDDALGFGGLQAVGERSSPGDPNTPDGLTDVKNKTRPANGEFLAQVQYTARLLGIEGRPVRNFSLFLNVQDVDVQNIDVPQSGVPNEGIQCLTYIEGMRQLAIGLNALAKVIADQGNVVVLVTSEGGRDNNMRDSIHSFGIVMGPKRSGFGTNLIANLAEIRNPQSFQAGDPGSVEGGQNFTLASAVLRDPSGNAISGGANVGDLQVGVVRALAEMADSGVSLAELGNYLRVKS